MTAQTWTRPAAFPLGEDRPFLREHEWVILKLLCRPLESLAGDDADALSRATGGQITPERADELIRTVRLARLPGLGSWAARLLAEIGLDAEDARTMPPAEIADRLAARFGYPLWNDETVRRFAALQAQWRKAPASDAPSEAQR